MMKVRYGIRKIHTVMYSGSPSPTEGYLHFLVLIQDFSTIKAMYSTSLTPRLSETPSRKQTTSLVTHNTPNSMVDSKSP